MPRLQDTFLPAPGNAYLVSARCTLCGELRFVVELWQLVLYICRLYISGWRSVIAHGDLVGE
jgi:ribosomal protein S14